MKKENIFKLHFNNIKKWIFVPFIAFSTGAKAIVPLIAAGYMTAYVLVGATILIVTGATALVINKKPNTNVVVNKTQDGFKVTSTVVSSTAGKPTAVTTDYLPKDGGGKKSTTTTCMYPLGRSPTTSAPLNAPFLEQYPYMINSLIIKEIASDGGRPFSDINKWQRDASVGMSVVGNPLFGAFLVKLETPATASQVANIIAAMFKSDEPRPEVINSQQRCRYDYIEPNWIDTKQADINPPNDPFFKYQWNLKGSSATTIDLSSKFGADFYGAWKKINAWTTLGNKLTTVNIGIIDSGILNVKGTNTTLANQFAGLTTNTISDIKYESSVAIDKNLNVLVGDKGYCHDQDACHGEQVASVMAANTNNSIGISGALGVGMNYGEKEIFKISTVKVFNGLEDRTDNWTIMSAIVELTGIDESKMSAFKNNNNYRQESKVRVINISLGTDYAPCSEFMNRSTSLIHKITRKKLVIVAAAGNRPRTEFHHFPRTDIASCDNVIPVVSHDEDGKSVVGAPSGEKNTINQLESLSAPGEKVMVMSSYGTGELSSGSSFAAPHVSALAAMILSINPNLSLGGVALILKESGTKPTNGSRLYPAINAEASVSMAIDNKYR